MARKILTVIQARTNSSRLPGKILLSLCGEPLLLRMIERVGRARYIQKLVVATTNTTGDEAIVELCRERGLDVFRGHPDDLLDRHYQAAKHYKADIVVKIPSDFPLIDHRVIDKVLGYFMAQPELEYASNLHPPTYPEGNGVEIMTFGALEFAWLNTASSMERELTTPFLWENPDKFKLGNVKWERGINLSMTHRWTIDYPEDYTLISEIYSRLYPGKPDFDLYDILGLLQREPELIRLNARYAGVNWHPNQANELRMTGHSG